MIDFPTAKWMCFGADESFLQANIPTVVFVSEGGETFCVFS